MARPKNTSGMGIAELQRLIDQQKNELNRLKRRRAVAEREVANIDSQIARLEGRGGAGRRMTAGGRVRNSKNLPDTIADVLRSAGKALGVSDIISGVQRAGYHSRSGNFRGIISQALIKDRKRFPKVSRGVYGLKSEGRKKGAEAGAE